MIVELSTGLKLKQWYLDPVLFFREVYRLEPYPYQAQIMRDIKDLSMRRILWQSAAGIGKTITCSAIGLWSSTVLSYHLNGSYDTIIVSGSLEQSRKLYDYSKVALSTNKVLSSLVVGEPLKSLTTFSTGSHISALPNSHKAIQGQHCYDSETSVLTSEGFKLFSDLSNDDELATLDKNGFIKYQRPTKLWVYKYEGNMIWIHNSQVDLLTTPNHRHFIRTNRWGWKLLEADQLPTRFWLKRDALWDGREKATFTLSKYYVEYHKRLYPDRIIPMDDWLEFLGYYLSEGNCEVSRGNRRISIGQMDSPKKDKIISCIRRLGYHPVILWDRIRISDRQLYEYLKDLGNSAWEKFIPNEFKGLSSRQLLILLNSLALGDGTIHGDSIKFRLSSRPLIEAIGEIGLKCGYSITFSEEASYSKFFPRNRKIYRIKPSYTVNLGKRGNIVKFSETKSGKVEIIPYSGMVYCVSVPNEIIFVKRHGKTCWSGNSHLEIVDEASIAGDFVINDSKRVVSPYTEDHLDRRIFLGTPFDAFSLFVNMFDDKKNYPDWNPSNPELENSWKRYFYTALDCPKISKSAFEEARSGNQETFTIFWLGEKYEVTDTVVPLKDIKKVSDGVPRPDWDPSLPTYFGVDWGFTSSTVLIITQDFEESGIKKHRVVDVLVWNRKEYEDVHTWINTLGAQYKPVATYCFPPETMVMGSPPLQISKITALSSIYGNENVLQYPIKFSSRPFRGNLIRIKARGLLPFMATEEHQVLVSVKRRRVDYRNYRQIYETEYSPPLWKPLGDLKSKDSKYWYKYEVDCLVFPKFKDDTGPSKIFIEEKEVKLTPSLMRAFGLYLAEGCSIFRNGKGVAVVFTFGSREGTLAREVARTFMEAFGESGSIKQYSDNSIRVTFYSKTLSEFFRKSFGHLAGNKFIPDFIMRSRKELTNEFLKAYNEGDGCSMGSIGTASEMVALQVQKLYSKLGKFVPVNKSKPVGETSLIKGRMSHRRFPYFIIRTEDRPNNFSGEDDDNFYLPVTKITEVEYDGPVYNFSTSDKTYQVSNILVHNCDLNPKGESERSKNGPLRSIPVAMNNERAFLTGNMSFLIKENRLEISEEFVELLIELKKLKWDQREGDDRAVALMLSLKRDPEPPGKVTRYVFAKRSKGPFWNYEAHKSLESELKPVP